MIEFPGIRILNLIKISPDKKEVKRKFMKKNILFPVAIILFIAGTAHPAWSWIGKPIKLWKTVSGMKEITTEMYMRKADGSENTGAAVIVCPGGSYHHLGIISEGHKTSSWFAKRGVTAFTLRYRVAGAGWHHPAMLQDVQRAIQLVRENAEEYGINPGKIGVIGFSAGGHLALMAGAFFSSRDELQKLGIEHTVSLRPDFVIPVYPVVSMMDGLAHERSRRSLLGKKPTEEMKESFSMEKQIPADMPPVYIVAAKDDTVVDYRNSEVLYKALTEKGIECRFALYETGGHGFGMKNNKFAEETRWRESMWQWLVEKGFVKQGLATEAYRVK